MRKKYYIKYMENKYLKYKKKYLNLKKEYNKLTGGSSETESYENELDYNQLIKVLQDNLQNENTNNILLIVYAPWCHFCKEFLKNGSYEELIKQTEGNNIYVINGDNHSKELEDINLEILGFPTLFRLVRIKQHSENVENKEILKEFNIVDYAGQSTDIKHIVDFKNKKF